MDGCSRPGGCLGMGLGVWCFGVWDMGYVYGNGGVWGVGRSRE